MFAWVFSQSCAVLYTIMISVSVLFVALIYEYTIVIIDFTFPEYTIVIIDFTLSHLAKLVGDMLQIQQYAYTQYIASS